MRAGGGCRAAEGCTVAGGKLGGGRVAVQCDRGMQRRCGGAGVGWWDAMQTPLWLRAWGPGGGESLASRHPRRHHPPGPGTRWVGAALRWHTPPPGPGAADWQSPVYPP